VPSAVVRECFEVTVAVETGETTINLVSMSDATGAVAVKGPVLNVYIHDRALALAGHADAHPDEDRPGFFNEQNIAEAGRTSACTATSSGQRRLHPLYGRMPSPLEPTAPAIPPCSTPFTTDLTPRSIPPSTTPQLSMAGLVRSVRCVVTLRWARGF